MTDQPDKAANKDRDAAGRPPARFAMMARAFVASPQSRTLFMLGGAIVVVLIATAYGQIRLNAWNKPFYDALARKDLPGFLQQLLVFLAIAGALLALNVAQIWLNQMIKLKLREGLLRDLLDQWLAPGRAFRLAAAGEIGVNPDQRLHEDARHLTELSTDLGIGLLQASLLLASFIGVLWVLSSTVVFSVSGNRFSIPGYMVWCALVYAGAGSWLSWRVGRPLIPLNAERYAREADLRFALVRVNEHADGVALYGGEADERQRLGREVDNVLAILRRLVTGSTRLTWVTAGYGWLAIVAPILVASPGYFGGDLTLGGLMVAAGAFTQVQQSLRWFVDNFNTIADWLATLRRVALFRRALIDLDHAEAVAGRIERVRASEAKITFDDLRVVSPAGSGMLDVAHVEIAPGEHVLVMGEPGASLTALFRAIAGLSLAGSGRIAIPRRGRHVHAAAPLHAAGRAARHARLSLLRDGVYRPGFRRRLPAHRAGPPLHAARPHRELGQRAHQRGGATSCLCAAAAAQTALDLHRRSAGFPRRSRPPVGRRAIRRRTRRRGRHHARPPRSARRILEPGASLRRAAR